MIFTYISSNITFFHTETFSSASVWYHEMGIAIPHVNDFPDAAMLAIMGSDNDDFLE